MDKDVQQIIKGLKKKSFSPIYWLQGEEPYYIDHVSDYIEENALQEAEKGFNQIILYGKDVDMNGVLQNARRFPMMSEYQVVIVKEAQEITDLGKSSGQEALKKYAENPTKSTILVFNYKYKKLDARKAHTKAIAKSGIVYTSSTIWDNQLLPWIDSFVKQEGLSINPKAKMLLAESIGTNLSRMANEIKKVVINLKDGEEINEDHIQKYIGISKDFNVFELQNALARKNASKVFRIINYFGENPKSHPLIPVLANLFSYFSKLLIAQEQKIRTENDVKNKLGLHYYAAKDFMPAIKNYNYRKALDIIDALQIADLQSKGIGFPPMSEKEILKELTYRILH